jgi:hypothetical protein
MRNFAHFGRLAFEGLAVLCFLNLSSCTSDSKDGGVDGPTDSSISLSDSPVGNEWRMGFNWASPESYYRTVYDLWQRGKQLCMEAKGFEYSPPEYMNTDRNYSLLNPLNESAAREFGYHNPYDVLAEIPSVVRFEIYYDAADECGNISQGYAYGGVETLAVSSQLTLLHDGAESAIDGFFGSDVGKSPVEDWALCMKQRGYLYSSPEEPSRDFVTTDVVSEGEVRVRLTDLACDEEVGLTRSRSTFESAAIAAWAQDNSESIHQLEVDLGSDQKLATAKFAALTEQGVIVLGPVSAPKDAKDPTASTLAQPP